MKLLTLILATLTLTGCGTHGVPLPLANYYNDRDPCQSTRNARPAPDWCGSGQSTQILRDAQGRYQGSLTR